MASGTYFFVRVGTAVFTALTQDVLAAAILRSVAAFLALDWCAYAHVVAATLVAEGVGRTIP